MQSLSIQAVWLYLRTDEERWQAPDRYKDRAGGYCRVVRTMPRRGDNSKMGVIELV